MDYHLTEEVTEKYLGLFLNPVYPMDIGENIRWEGKDWRIVSVKKEYPVGGANQGSAVLREIKEEEA